MKKILAALTLAASFPVMASGVYVGGQLGWANTNLEVSPVSFDDSAFIGGFYAGYEFDMNQFFVAIEGDANFGNAKVNISGVELKRKNVYGISGLIGMPLSSEFDLYGRAGWARTEFSADSDSETENGYNLGVGGRYHLNDQLAARAEYRYNKYSVDDPFKVYDHMFTVGLQYSF